MKLKLHNKFEITHNNTTYTAYNTLLSGVFSKISKLEQYTSHIAIGTGTKTLDFSAQKLTTFLRSFKAETEEINCDIKNGTLFIKKMVSIDQELPETFSFSELGICASSEFDPDIFNHVLLTDKEGNPVSVTRRAGDTLVIRVTIYLELTNLSDALFISGENKFIRRLLGDDFETDDNTLYAVRGDNLSPNEYVERQLPNMQEAVKCTSKISASQDGATITFSAELGEGETEELVVVFEDQACMRLNTQLVNDPVSTSKSLETEELGYVELGKNIKSVESVSPTAENYTLTHYAKKLADKIEKPFIESFDASTPRYVSADGKYIAFIKDAAVHLYKNENYAFTKLNTTQMQASNIFKMFILDDVILTLATTSPYFRVYEIANNAVISQSVDFNAYNDSIFNYNWFDADACISNGTIILGLILNNDEKRPVVLRIKKVANTYHDTLANPSLTTAKRVFAVQKSPYYDAVVNFVTDTYRDRATYVLEEFNETSNRFMNTFFAHSMLADTTKVIASGRVVLAQKTIAPYAEVYYYPDLKKASESFTTSLEHYASKDGNYVIVKNGENYEIKNLHKFDEMLDFENTLGDYISASEVEAFEFMFDTLLVFTSSSVFGITLKKQYAKIDNLSTENESYLVNFTKYDLMGAAAFEGVKMSLKFSFSISPSAAAVSMTNQTPLSRITRVSDFESFKSNGEVRIDNDIQ